MMDTNTQAWLGPDLTGHSHQKTLRKEGRLLSGIYKESSGLSRLVFKLRGDENRFLLTTP